MNAQLRYISLLQFFLLLFSVKSLKAQGYEFPGNIQARAFNPATQLWYHEPAKSWQDALPVGNGRLGAMVFGGYGEERIQLNEETYWTGGPYSTVQKGGAAVLPEIQRLVFEEKYLPAHNLFGRRLMGYPVEQQKYQALANLHLFFSNQDSVTNYYRSLNCYHLQSR